MPRQLVTDTWPNDPKVRQQIHEIILRLGRKPVDPEEWAREARNNKKEG